MPHPTQVTHDQIIRTARHLFEMGGYEGVTMAQLAGALGIKAPSLYKHFDDKNALLKAVNTLTMQELTQAMRDAIATQNTPYQQCLAMGRAYWEYALAHPMAYHLALSTHNHISPDPQYLEALALPLQAIFAESVGGESLVALRGAWALLHGFVALHLTGRFQRGGDIYTAYERALGAYLAGWGIE